MLAPELLLVRLCLAGPLLYIGLYMTIEPTKFVTSLCTLAGMVECALQNFQQALRRQEPFREPDSIVMTNVTDRVRILVKTAGLLLVFSSLLFLTGLAD